MNLMAKKVVPLLVCSNAMLSAFRILLRSLHTGEGWRIIFSARGFGLIVLYTVLIFVKGGKTATVK